LRFTHLSAREKQIRGVTKVFNQLLNSVAPESVESRISANHSRLYKRLMEGSLVKDLRILIVDDSETTRRILRAIIRSREWIICGEAETGRAGIRQFQKLKTRFGLDRSGHARHQWHRSGQANVNLESQNPSYPIHNIGVRGN
jgi:hypothetical protein